MLRKILACVLCAALMLSAAGCSKKPAGAGNEDAMEFVSQLKIGWNLGNSLDASGSGPFAETAWGNPETTEEMILDIRAMGFNTIRIPVSWGTHCDEEGTVDSAWMARVHEVVDYAYQNGLYVILNSHHDTDYYAIGSSVESESIRTLCSERMEKLWTQIAQEFKDYGERLIFETLNEPRTVGSEKEWSGGTKEEREIVYDLNKVIVQAIRATGGNNATRYIMVPSYAATPNIDVLREMELPQDEWIIVSVHAYSPYDFAMNGDAPGTFTDADKEELDGFFDALDELFTSRNIPVIIGEFGATNKENLKDRCAWAKYYVRGAKEKGIACIVWDNNHGGIGAENFGLYDRRAGEWYFPELAKAYVDAAQ